MIKAKKTRWFILIGLLITTYFVVFKLADIQYATPCRDDFDALIVSDVGPFWVKLAGSNEKVWLGTRTTKYNYKKTGSSHEIWLVSLKNDEVTFLTRTKYRQPIDGNFYQLELKTMQCQFSFSISDPNYQPRQNEPLVEPNDFSSNWSFDRYFQFASVQPYTRVGQFAEGYWVLAYVEVNGTKKYKILLNYYEFTTHVIAYTEYRLSLKHDRYTGGIQHIVLPVGNSSGSCIQNDTKCKYSLQYHEYFLTLNVQSLSQVSQWESKPIEYEDWKYLVELATGKFLAAIGE